MASPLEGLLGSACGAGTEDSVLVCAAEDSVLLVATVLAVKDRTTVSSAPFLRLTSKSFKSAKLRREMS